MSKSNSVSSDPAAVHTDLITADPATAITVSPNTQAAESVSKNSASAATEALHSQTADAASASTAATDCVDTKITSSDPRPEHTEQDSLLKPKNMSSTVAFKKTSNSGSANSESRNVASENSVCTITIPSDLEDGSREQNNAADGRWARLYQQYQYCYYYYKIEMCACLNLFVFVSFLIIIYIFMTTNLAKADWGPEVGSSNNNQSNTTESHEETLNFRIQKLLENSSFRINT